MLAIGIPMLCSLAGSLLMGLIYCLLTVTLRANQNVTGLAITTFGVGVGNFFGGSLIKLAGSEVPSIALSTTSGYFSKSPPFAAKARLVRSDIPVLRLPRVSRDPVIALLASYFLKHTRPGLHLRAVGESPSTADAAGINVTRYKYLATCIGGMIAGLGGLYYYVMDYASGVWSNNGFGDRGWLANPALVVAVAAEQNALMLGKDAFDQLVERGREVLTPSSSSANCSSSSAMIVLRMVFGPAMDWLEPRLRNSNLLPVKATGEVRLRSVVSLGDGGQDVHADAQALALAVGVVVIVYDAVHDRLKLLAEEYRNDRREALRLRRDDGRCRQTRPSSAAAPDPRPRP